MLFFYCNTDAQLHMLQQELAAVTEREITAQTAFVKANKRPLKQTNKNPKQEEPVSAHLPCDIQNLYQNQPQV